ncbi:AbrB/MazE/SpoVT family DNA-binding domain-containing protein [Ignavigranum ruoffiae]|uniref:AbrB/MazE/SpoVT family DNA-binding domain-containing protein n=1 Tax=Ignavigranum ruoffiae TaxID=89093 RepID=UPI002046CA70|nr:AbrB/MazE/SpoVT family DNA-binding domain-containing protein [Ignavigranum ruoffiae]UPQ86105.1 AbrB/MazE/SpoVT family DNA-binding domain-containing protein [Ignavigranum ruoffiae]
MEKRKLNAIVAKAGGTAGQGSYNYKMTIPSAWAKEMGITKEDRELKVYFEKNKIIVEKG